MKRTVLIMGAAGRDFHVFNTCYRDDPGFEVVAFTATQIPHIDGRRYPASLAGYRYPAGIPIVPEEELERILRDRQVDDVIFAYSDVSLAFLKAQEQRALAAGAKSFATFDIDRTMVASSKPVIAVGAARTGCGKSQVARRILELLRKKGLRAVAIRHPMPYGDLAAQAVQRFASIEDLEAQKCTIEEMEEYEPHIRNGHVVYAGVDYERILRAAEKEADVIIWDGGNNDTPFYRPDLHVTVLDALRPGHELDHFPGRDNLMRAHLLLINKIDTAEPSSIAAVRRNAAELNPGATVLTTSSPVTLADPDKVRGKRALVIEDGPTLTHGGMSLGAGVVAAKRAGVAELVDPSPYAVGELAATYAKYPNARGILPAMGYGAQQLRDLAATIAATPCDVVVIATPIDLGRVVAIQRPAVRVTYELGPEADLALDAAITVATRRRPLGVR